MLAKINWRPGHAEIKYFANTLIVLAIVFAGILLLMGKAKPALFVGVGGLVLAIACRIAPLVGRWTYLLWTAVSFALSMLVSPIVIGIIFYLVLTPIALIARISGKDELRLKRQREGASYFESAEYDTSPDAFKRQY